MNTAHLHPMLIHFPIALVVFGFLAEVLALKFKSEAWLTKTGFFLLVFGTVSAILAAFTGLFFTREVSGLAIELEEKHELFAWITLFFLFLTTIFRVYIEDKKLFHLRWSMLVLYGISVVFVVVTGLLGGSLVHNYLLSY
jgi:uncharacterized membrane protein